MLSLVVVLSCSGEPFVASTPGGAGTSGGGSGGTGNSPQPGTAGVGGEVIEGGAPGSGGWGGSSDAGGTAASGATAGAEAAGGAELEGDGGASAGNVCPSRAGSDWALGFFPEIRQATAQESHPFFQIANLGVGTASLRRLRIRYYFSKETDVPETAVCYWVTGDRCSDAKLEFGDVVVPKSTASRYLEITFPGAGDVAVFPGTFEVRVGFKTGASPLIQTNDYSFDPDASAPSSATPFPYKRWPLTTLYLDGELVWGTEPCPA